LPGLRRYARALTGDAWAADDLLQDTLERACSKWRLWLAGSDLRAWLFTLMHNLFIDRVRRGQLQSMLISTMDLDDATRDIAGPAQPLDAAIDLQRCLLRLPEEQRVVLLLVTLEDMSYAEVAKITGAPAGTVMSRLSRARERMRELMDESRVPSTDRFTPETAPQQLLPALRRMK
jgi:RNA polymerase sigma-70 factor (ECF subfamily)